MNTPGIDGSQACKVVVPQRGAPAMKKFGHRGIETPSAERQDNTFPSSGFI
jgi:hypothetical protein